MGRTINIYGGLDPCDAPLYTARDISRYLRIKLSTIRYWIAGRTTTTGKIIHPVVADARHSSRMISFNTAAELHALRVIRFDHKVSMQRVRAALDFVEKRLKISRPLINAKFQTDGIDLFIQHLGEDLLVASQCGQISFRDVLSAGLKRIEVDQDGLARMLYPYTVDRPLLQDSPRLIAMDPRKSFGRPIIAGTRLKTSAVMDRFLGGDSAAAIAEDFGLTVAQVEEAVRCETASAA